MKLNGLKKVSILFFTLIFCGACNEPSNIESSGSKEPINSETTKENENKENENKDKEANGNEEINQDPPVPIPVEPIYDEPEDSLEGIDVNDLSQLITAAGKVTGNYSLESEQFFNEESNNYYKINYGELLEDSWTVNYSEEDTKFDLVSFNEEYISTHDFTRISSNKYETKNAEAISDFLYLICPQYKNTGYYMTFKRVTIEIDEDIQFSRIRLYCSGTQVGKLISLHKDSTKSNWYLLFMESIVKFN